MEQREQQERQQERENVLIEGVHCTCPKRRGDSVQCFAYLLDHRALFQGASETPRDLGLHPWVTKGFVGND